MGFKVARKAMLVVLCAMGICCFGEEERHATGLLIPPHRRRAVSAESANDVPRRAKSLLGAAKANNESLPERWDSREHYTDGLSWISPVKNQGNVGACWAFASYATLETQMRRLGLGDWDFSEKNLVNLHGLVQDPEGGMPFFAAAYLLRWGGPVAETNDEYIATLLEWKQDSVQYNPPFHVQNVVWIPPRSSSTDNATLKKAIMEYGAVAVPMYCEKEYMNELNGAYYYNGWKLNHVVAVVGWDDKYSRDNFGRMPGGNGAWIVKNSWGADSGDNGYLYVSYYDTMFHKCSWLHGAVFMPATGDDEYTAVYGYDRLGSVGYDLEGEGCPIGAIFKASWNEELAAIGLYSCVAPLDYKISIYTNVIEGLDSPTPEKGVLAYEQYGCLTNIGYTTIPLDCHVPLVPGENFSVVFANTNDCARYFCVCAQDFYAPDFTPITDVTFYAEGNGWRDSTGNTFYDIYGYSYRGNICLKAYTRSTVAAKDSGPGETADGTKMCEAVAATNSVLYAQAAQTFGAFANIVGDNSRSLWYSWMAGLDPSDPADDFTVSLTLTNNVPYLTWSPDNLPQRTYTIYGTSSLTGGKWEKIAKSALKTTTNKFFKVEIDAN